MRHLILLCCTATALACGGVAAEAEPGDDLAAPRHLYSLVNAPFPGPHPSALVYLGKGFRAAGPLNLVVHFHGWANCIENEGEARNAPCTRGGPVRIAHDLFRQLDQSGANAALILVERSFDQSNSDDGRLAEPGLFRAMILELLPKLGALAGRGYAEKDLGSIVLSSHSGGYRALAHSLDRGGLTHLVTQVILLDSVYDNAAEFEAFAQEALGAARLAIVYTDRAGTAAGSQQIAAHAKGWLAAARLDPKLLVDDRTTGTLPDAALAAPLLFKRSGASHDGTAQLYFGKLLAHAGLR